MAAEDTKADEKSVEPAEPLLQQTSDQPEYGYLKLLEGIWINKNNELGGLNIISLPAPGTEPTQPGRPGSFIPIVFKYNETLKFSLRGPARNRGGFNDQLNGAVIYKQEVFGSETENNDDLKLQHVEDGMFLFLGDIREKQGDPPQSGDLYKPKFNYVRSGTVPHGNTLTILGNEVEPTEGPPNFDSKELQELLNPISATMGDPNGTYAKELTDKLKALGTDATKCLKDGIAGQTITNTRTLVLSSKNGGTVQNTPFISKFANCTSMDVIFWIETVKNDDGTTFQQLQYLQRMILDFQMANVEKIEWPHITVNTMVFK